jgi:8-oxo-dGTP diphosphatase
VKFTDFNGASIELEEGRTVSWRPSAYALVRKDDKILFVKTKQHGKWELPGGGVELHEKIWDGMIREVFEETGYKISAKNKLPFYIENNSFYAPDVDEYFNAIPMFFEAELESEVQIKDHIDFENEVHEIKWISLNELKTYNINSITLNALEQINEN